MIKDEIKELIEELIECREIEAIALGGSRGNGREDEYSDYDFYIYLNEDFEKEKRREILEKYCSYLEVGNKFWEEEDDGVLSSGVEIEFIYRKIEDIEKNLKSVVDGNEAGIGYTTCFWDNVINSKILYDRRGELGELVSRYNIKYPEELKKNIVEKNHKLLKDYMPSLYYQIRKAIKRNDFISINHRLTEFMGVYFDILFAINGETHKGEKRLLETTENFEILPKNYKEVMEKLFSFVYRDNEKFIKTLDEMCFYLYELLKKNGYSVTSESYKSKEDFSKK